MKNWSQLLAGVNSDKGHDNVETMIFDKPVLAKVIFDIADDYEHGYDYITNPMDKLVSAISIVKGDEETGEVPFIILSRPVNVEFPVDTTRGIVIEDARVEHLMDGKANLEAATKHQVTFYQWLRYRLIEEEII